MTSKVRWAARPAESLLQSVPWNVQCPPVLSACAVALTGMPCTMLATMTRRVLLRCPEATLTPCAVPQVTSGLSSLLEAQAGATTGTRPMCCMCVFTCCSEPAYLLRLYHICHTTLRFVLKLPIWKPSVDCRCKAWRCFQAVNSLVLCTCRHIRFCGTAASQRTTSL